MDEPGLIRPRGNRSHVAGTQDEPLWRITIPQLMDAAVARWGERDAAVFCAAQTRWTYRELAAEADALAAGLHALGIGKGERVGVWSPNRPEWLAAQIATARIGAILVNINPAYRAAELEYALNKSGCKALLTAAAFQDGDYLGMINDLAPELKHCRPGELKSERLPRLQTVIRLAGDAAGTMTYRDAKARGAGISKAKLDEISATLAPDEPINIQFTSGTTGAPKGATLSHFNIINNGRFCAQAMRLSARDRLCIPVPLYHCFGMVLGNLACISCGAAMIFPGEGFDAEATLSAVAGEKCTALHGVPTMFIAQLDHPRFAEFDVSHLRTGIMAGAPCPIEVMRRAAARMHLSEITIAYGMTETSPVSFQSAADDPLEKRVATVGRIHPSVEVKIVNDQGEIAAVGERGELLTRGYSVMRGYWDDPARTAEAIDADGWMHTGDLATLDSDGYCAIVGRRGDMLIRGGENIYPREIEEFLYRCPQVREAQVFGVSDPKYGEEVCAWIIPPPGAAPRAEEIREFCRGQIARHKIPRHIRFVESFPRTATGKPQKFKMRAAMEKEIGV